TKDRAADGAPSWSPDGSHIAFESSRKGNFDTWTMKRDGTELQQLNFVTGFDGNPSWSPDGTMIVFQSDRSGVMDLYTINADGSNVQLYVGGSSIDENPNWGTSNARTAS